MPKFEFLRLFKPGAFLLALSVLLTFVVVVQPNSANALIGGEELTAHDQMSKNVLRISTPKTKCTASVIAKYWAITAEHCRVDLNTFSIQGGIDKKAFVYYMPDKTFPLKSHDLKLIRIPQGFRGPYPQLPNQAADTEGMSVVYGWGIGTNRYLKKAYSHYRPGYEYTVGAPRIYFKMINKNNALWKGDSGGPTYRNNTLIGISSTVFARTNDLDSNSVYIMGNIYSAKEWILKTIRDNNPVPPQTPTPSTPPAAPQTPDAKKLGPAGDTKDPSAPPTPSTPPSQSPGAGAAPPAGKPSLPSTTPPQSINLTGHNRYDTNAKTALTGFSKSDIIFLANGETLADALSAGPAAAVNNAPLLLSTKDSLPLETKEAITSLSPKKAVIVGGYASIAPTVDNDLKALGITNIERIIGQDRIDTSLKIAEKYFPNKTKALYASAWRFPDALSAASAGALLRIPVILVGTNWNTVTTESIVVGGKSVLLDPTNSSNFLRIAGENRIETSLLLAKEVKNTLSSIDSVAFVNGWGIPDALSAINLANHRAITILFAASVPDVSNLNLQQNRYFVGKPPRA